MENQTTIRGYKVTNPDGRCRGFLFEVGKDYKYDGEIKICNSGFHFCIKAAHCFSYYDFDSKNLVFEVETIGNYATHNEDSKIVTDHIRIIRQLTWDEVLTVANDGKNNTGHSNTGFLKDIPYKDAFQNMWHYLSEENKAHFTSLPNFDWEIFTEITGVKQK